MTVDFAIDEVTGVLDNPIRREIEDVAKKWAWSFQLLSAKQKDELPLSSEMFFEP